MDIPVAYFLILSASYFFAFFALSLTLRRQRKQIREAEGGRAYALLEVKSITRIGEGLAVLLQHTEGSLGPNKACLTMLLDFTSPDTAAEILGESVVKGSRYLGTFDELFNLLGLEPDESGPL